MEYEFNRNFLKPEPKPNFEEVQKKVKELILKSNQYFPQEKELHSELNRTYKSVLVLDKEITVENIKNLEEHWSSSVKKFNNIGVKHLRLQQNNSLTPESDLSNLLAETEEKIKQNTIASKKHLENKPELDKELKEETSIEAQIAKIQAAISAGIDPEEAITQAQKEMAQSAGMKKMPTIGKPGFNVRDRIASTLKAKEAQKTFEIAGDILGQRNFDISKKCQSGYYTPELLNSANAQLLHLAALNNPSALQILVGQGGADINMIKPEWVPNPETQKEIERLQYEKNNPIKAAIGIRQR